MRGRAMPGNIRRAGRAPYWFALAVALGVVAVAWIARGRVQRVDAGYPAPDFEVVDAHGSPVSLADYQGRVVLLNIWATWCAPCLEEMPSMQRLYDAFSPDDFVIAAVSIDAPVGDADAAGNPGGDPLVFASRLGLTFPILLDPPGEIQRIYQTTGVPESFLIGPHGIIYKKVAGATAWDSEANVGLVRRLIEGG